MSSKELSVCFTGHRDFPCHNSGLVLAAVETLIRQGYTRFYAGGARGFDSRAAQCVLYLRRKYPQISLHLLLPCEKARQTRGWKYRDIRLYDYLRANADSVKVLSPDPKEESKYIMQKRNRALVEAADFCLCWYNIENPYSGTGQTVRMACKAELELHNLMDGALWV